MIARRNACWQALLLCLCLCLCLCIDPCQALEITLRAPLTTVVPAPAPLPGQPVALRAVVTVPADAPPDLGIGAYSCDAHGRWYQTCSPVALTPGRHVLQFDLGPSAALVSEPLRVEWSRPAASRAARVGVFLWSASASRSAIGIELEAAAGERSPAAGAAQRLDDIRIDGLRGQTPLAQVAAGQRWSLSLRPYPQPENPDDPAQFTLDGVFTGPGGEEYHVPGFSFQAMTVRDLGDRDEALPRGDLRMVLRFRPRLPGRYTVRVVARWGAGEALSVRMPDLLVSGPASDEVVHVDAVDHRFFSAGGAFCWPVGLNLHGVTDLRSRDQLGTDATPNLRASATIAKLERLAAAGGDATEIWLSSWNLGLEWRGDWPGFAGIGRFSQENAARLDLVLDAAWRNHVRVNLVINNHGQAAEEMDSEWGDNPWNTRNGGPLSGAGQLFSDARALAGQERLRRYLIARYGDHPAILGWKLWSEINLTAGNADAPAHQAMLRWHEQAAARWHQLDSYHHPVTTHWAGDFHAVDWDIAALPGIDYLCIDAYHGGPGGRGGSDLLAVLLRDSVQDGAEGLARFGKPLLVTEYGGSAMGAEEALLEAEHASGAWSALVTGHAAAPMLWWFEWVDECHRYQPYRAITDFIKGEDLRGAEAATRALVSVPASANLWAQAWVRPGRVLGYVLDRSWQQGGQPVLHQAASADIIIGSQVPQGACRVQWWDADSGALIADTALAHPGGELRLPCPAFRRHLAFKLWRGREQAP
jgi:hypothetical protein